MNRKKEDDLIKRYRLEHLVPLAITILSTYFWISKFKTNGVYFSGILISLSGLVIWWLAKFTIGENWSAGYGNPKIKKLVTNGIYFKIRHPLYFGINLTLLGLCLVHQNIILSLLSLIIVVYFFYRMKLETEFLVKTLGKSYIDYMKRTWF
jgi:protein-S-isoprenylcysteine O-methyltransferase Ste14